MHSNLAQLADVEKVDNRGITAGYHYIFRFLQFPEKRLESYFFRKIWYTNGKFNNPPIFRHPSRSVFGRIIEELADR